jgi:hypothetical protein
MAASSARRVLPVHAPQTDAGRDRRAQQKPRQIAAIPPRKSHHQKGDADTGQGGMAHRVRDQRAFAQEQEGSGDPRRGAQKSGPKGDKRGVIAELQQQSVQ